MNTQVFVQNPSWNSIMALNGLELLWPLTDHLFLFNAERFEDLHKEVFLLIELFNES